MRKKAVVLALKPTFPHSVIAQLSQKFFGSIGDVIFAKTTARAWCHAAPEAAIWVAGFRSQAPHGRPDAGTLGVRCTL
jgi:hypothetical protein